MWSCLQNALLDIYDRHEIWNRCWFDKIFMFVLVRIRDSVSVEPCNFSKPIREAVIDELNRKYCNRIIPDVGLAVKTFDIISMDDPIVHPGSGSYYVKGIYLLHQIMCNCCSCQGSIHAWFNRKWISERGLDSDGPSQQIKLPDGVIVSRKSF